MDPPARTRSSCAARPATATWSSCAGTWASSRRRTRTRSGPGRAARSSIAPLFLLYDYSFRPPGAATKEEALAHGHEAGVVCTDEILLHPDPYPSREAWCGARLAETERRLAAATPGLPTVLVNHFPLVREPTRILRYPEFAQWCGTDRTADWHLRYRRRAPSSTATCTSPAPPGTTASASRRSRSATRASGTGGTPRQERSARCSGEAVGCADSCGSTHAMLLTAARASTVTRRKRIFTCLVPAVHVNPCAFDRGCRLGDRAGW